MSTDLHLSQLDLSEIKLPRLKVNNSSSPDGNGSETKVNHEEEAVNHEEVEEECHTPKSPRNLIPEMLVCPPAPRKPRQPLIRCKRKLSEFNFAEMVAREEVESLFKSAASAKIRRCFL